MTAFTDLLSATATVSRNSDGSGMVEQGDVSVMPVMPVGQRLVEELDLNALREPVQTFCGDEDVLEGDRLVIAGTTYEVRWVGTWPWDDSDEYLHIVAEVNRHA